VDASKTRANRHSYALITSLFGHLTNITETSVDDFLLHTFTYFFYHVVYLCLCDRRVNGQ
jgi:hypothetical protein